MRLDGVETKVNVFGTDVPHAMDVLDLDDESTMRIWFYEDLSPGVPPLPLLEAGLILRVRVRDDGDVDTTVKLRPCRRSQLTPHWLAIEPDGDLEFTVEEDRSGPNRVLAASCQVEREASSVASLEGPPYLLTELLSREQLDFLDSCSTIRVNAAELTALGPIEATRWKEVGGLDYAGLKARAERWIVSGRDFLEISARADLLDAAATHTRLEELVVERDLALDVNLESKTRRVLTALVPPPG